MEFDIKHAIDQISKEKGIDRALIIEDSVRSAQVVHFAAWTASQCAMLRCV